PVDWVVPVEPPEPDELRPPASVVVVVGRFRRGLDDCDADGCRSVVVVVILCTAGDAAIPVGSARATPPPTDSPATTSSTPAPARAWLVRLRRSIGRDAFPRRFRKQQSAQPYHWHQDGKRGHFPTKHLTFTVSRPPAPPSPSARRSACR